MRMVHDPPEITVMASTDLSASPSTPMCNPSSTMSLPEIMMQAEVIITWNMVHFKSRFKTAKIHPRKHASSKAIEIKPFLSNQGTDKFVSAAGFEAARPQQGRTDQSLDRVYLPP
jgi:hypothetical protein